MEDTRKRKTETINSSATSDKKSKNEVDEKIDWEKDNNITTGGVSIIFLFLFFYFSYCYYLFFVKYDKI